MSIESITEKILAEAGAEAEKLLGAAKLEREGILAKAEQQAAAFRNEMDDKARKEAVLVKERKASVAELEARKLELAAKQSAIGKSFALALDALTGLPQDDYKALLVKTVAAAGVDGAELLLNPKDRAAVGPAVVEAVNAMGGPSRVTLADDTVDCRGGFVLRKGSMEINATLETMVGAIKEAVTPEVVETLF